MKTKSQARKGFSLLEAMMAMIMLSIVLMITVTLIHSSLIAVASTNMQCSMDDRVSRCMERMLRDLKDGGTDYSNFAISTDQKSITFARCIGYTTSADGTTPQAQYGNPITYIVVTNSTDTWIERREVVGESTQTETMIVQLCRTPVTVQNSDGSTMSVTGANFQMLTSGVVNVTLVLSTANPLLKLNSNGTDDNTVLITQSAVQMLNN